MNRLALDAILAEAHAKIGEVLRLMEDIDAIGDELHHHGYFQFPKFEYLFGHSCSDESEVVVESADFVLEMAEQGPRPPSARYVEVMRRRDWNREQNSETNRIVLSTFKSKRRAIAKKIREDIGSAAGWRCCYCAQIGGTDKGPDGRFWHIDHSYPFVLGGDDGKDNLVLACATCNLEKHAMSTLEFLRSRSSENPPPERLDESTFVIKQVVKELLDAREIPRKAAGAA